MVPGGTLLETITKRDLAQQVAKATGTQRNMAHAMVDSLFNIMRETLIEGNRIEIRGFGAFTVKDTKPKPAARNPKTGEVIYVPARRKTHFKPGKDLKNALHEVVK
jgi:integration host factor subunit beta